MLLNPDSDFATVARIATALDILLYSLVDAPRHSGPCGSSASEESHHIGIWHNQDSFSRALSNLERHKVQDSIQDRC